MSLLQFSDVLKKAGLDPTKVKLIRHSLSDKEFKKCYDQGPQMVREYTRIQKPNFSKGYDYWCVFISGKSTSARFFACYRVGDCVPDTPDRKPEGFALDDWFQGERAQFDLEPVDVLCEYENRLVIDWGGGTLAWHQKGTNEKPILSIESVGKRPFVGYDKVVLTYQQLKDVIENEANDYELWQTALRSVNAVYLIVDTESGQQYVGSAYGKDGLLGRWRIYADSLHGHNKLMKELICAHPERYRYFQFSILQILPKTLTPDEVIQVESLWKQKLRSIDFGMNDN